MQRQRARYLILLIAILSIAAGGFLGCSPQKRYEVLSFFFDGVPDPRAASGKMAFGPGGRLVSYLHKPYSEGKCGECHTDGDAEMSITRAINIKDITSAVCKKCHEKTSREFPFMHGPVAVGECMLCHLPHESPNEHLLIAPSPRICVQCHVPELMSVSRPEHKDEKADCLTCHVGHGSSARGLLRAKPATQPAGTSSAATQPSTIARTHPGDTPAIPAGKPAATQPAVSAVPTPPAGGGI